jgi:hypothetical protein
MPGFVTTAQRAVLRMFRQLYPKHLAPWEDVGRGSVVSSPRLRMVRELERQAMDTQDEAERKAFALEHARAYQYEPVDGTISIIPDLKKHAVEGQSRWLLDPQQQGEKITHWTAEMGAIHPQSRQHIRITFDFSIVEQVEGIPPNEKRVPGTTLSFRPARDPAGIPHLV